MKVLFVSNRFGTPFQRDLMQSLAATGHDVTFYAAGPSTFTKRAHIRWSEDSGIRRAELWNSPLVPGSSADPEAQIGSKEVDALTEEVLRTVRPDVVHAHELSGHGLSVLEVANGHAPTVVSIHNYWTVCPQLNLLDPDGVWCDDFLEGEKCTRCRWLPSASDRVVVEHMKNRLSGTPLFGVVRTARKLLRGFGAPRLAAPQPVGWSEPRYSADAFRRRRAVAVAALNEVSAIHVMSHRAGEVLSRFGVRSDHMAVIPISTFGLDTLKPVQKAATSGPLTFCYRGALSYAKGVHVLIEAFSRLDQSKARLLIYGSGEPDFETALRTAARGLNVTFSGEYGKDDLAAINAAVDVGVVPSVCNETFCLAAVEFLRSGVPVIATRMGGMLDYVVDGRNGLLVEQRDAGALQAAMERCLESPELLEQLRRSDPPPYTMHGVTDAMVDLYSRVIGAAQAALPDLAHGK